MSIGSSYNNSLLSEASYADFQGIDITDSAQVRVALTAEGFSQAQADDFVNSWKVVSHQPDTASGFSATLFESLDNPGTYTLAIRETAGGVDIFSADAFGIGTLGYARDQTYSLYNYFIRLITPSTENVGQWVNTGNIGLVDGAIVPLYEYQNNAAAGLGVIVDATGQNTNFDALVNVAGHSLGGNLALAFSRLFPEWTSGVYTYNAPGIAATAAVDNFFSSFGGNGNYPGNLSQLATNVVGAAGQELIAGFNGLPVPENSVFIEDQGLPSIENPAGNHSIKALTDALAVYNLLGSLDSTLELSQATPWLESASNISNKSLEAIVDAVGEIFGISLEVAIDDRNALYTGIDAIRTLLFEDPAVPNSILKPEYQNLQVVTPDTLVTSADLDTPDGLAYRYALEQLNPFAVTGGPALYSGQSELAAENFTAEYLEDRALFLNVKNRMFTADASALRLSSDRYFKDFEDETNPLVLRSTTSRSRAPQRFLFGSSRDDADLLGESENDRIYGRGGDDTLEGGGGNDYLEGGTGDDTYIFNAGDGVDTIFDADGLGSIEVRTGAGTTTLGGTLDSVPGAANLYEDDDENRYAKTGDDLLITLKDGAGQIVVKKFTDGMLGISLNATEVLKTFEKDVGFGTYTLTGDAGAYVSIDDARGTVLPEAA